MALDVLGRDVDTIGDDGFMGNGGGARSGSELSHLQTESVVIAFADKNLHHTLG